VSTLHTINKSQEHIRLYDSLTRAITSGDTVLLIEDACYSLLDRELIAELEETSGKPVLTLCDDHKARGLSEDLLGDTENLTNTRGETRTRGISYQEFVQQALLHNKTISWF
jgi:sulfur relay protein TusB/DsrH